MCNEDFDKYLKEIRNNISNIYNQFYTLKTLLNTLLNKQNEKIYNANKYFWGAVIRSLGQSIILDLSKLFENRKKSKKIKYDEIISIYFLLEFIRTPEAKEKIENKINLNKKVLSNLWKWRCKIFAHTDKEVFLNLDKFYQDYSLKYYEIEKLLLLAEEILGDIVSVLKNKGYEYSFKTFKYESQSDVRDIINKLKNE